jgi:hypothetical protein
VPPVAVIEVLMFVACEPPSVARLDVGAEVEAAVDKSTARQVSGIGVAIVHTSWSAG